MSDTILEVSYLTKKFPMERHFWQKPSYFTAVDDISFSIHAGETLGLLGESGCGKSTTARILMGLYPPDAGTVRYQGRELQGLSEKEYRPLRREIQMVFQNPFDSLDPGLRIRTQLLEPMSIWGIGSDRAERMKRIFALCEECGMPRDCLEKLPSEFSGGQLQRIAIIRALLLQPKLLIADEIVSALDIPIQNQILELLLRMKQKHGLTLLFITHDLAVMRKMADVICVMRNGRLLASGTYEELLAKDGQDPYIHELIEASYIFES